MNLSTEMEALRHELHELLDRAFEDGEELSADVDAEFDEDDDGTWVTRTLNGWRTLTLRWKEPTDGD